jgi:hypothetical protein
VLFAHAASTWSSLLDRTASYRLTLLEEVEAVLQRALVASKSKATVVVGLVSDLLHRGELGPKGNAPPEDAVGVDVLLAALDITSDVATGVQLANVRRERAPGLVGCGTEVEVVATLRIRGKSLVILVSNGSSSKQAYAQGRHEWE